jgi:hypothetical protein
MKFLSMEHLAGVRALVLAEAGKFGEDALTAWPRAAKTSSHAIRDGHLPITGRIIHSIMFMKSVF